MEFIYTFKIYPQGGLFIPEILKITTIFTFPTIQQYFKIEKLSNLIT